MKKNIKYMFTVLTVILLSCDDIIGVDDISEETINVLAPKEGAVLTNNKVSFNWDSLEEATGYHIQIALPSFENASQIIVDSIIVQDSLGYLSNRFAKTLLNNDYEWRIKGINSGYETIYVKQSFIVNGDEDLDITPPNKPSLVLPANASAQAETVVNFEWTRENIAGTAEKDSVFIYSDANLQTLNKKGLGANKTYSTTLSAMSTYYWNVRAYDEAGNMSEISSTFNFTIN